MTATGIASEPARTRRRHAAQERRPGSNDRPALGVPRDSDAARSRLGSPRDRIAGGVAIAYVPGTVS